MSCFCETILIKGFQSRQRDKQKRNQGCMEEQWTVISGHFLSPSIHNKDYINESETKYINWRQIIPSCSRRTGNINSSHIQDPHTHTYTRPLPRQRRSLLKIWLQVNSPEAGAEGLVHGVSRITQPPEDDFGQLVTNCVVTL